MSTPAVESGLLSRKLLVTTLAIVCTTALAAFEKMDANVGLVFGAGIAAFNWANLRHHQHYGDDDE
ncbi:MAG: hypothetical protein GY942_11785 [Aestuariibacter sp.]|nr:hypothetical protein [Aestuariibacter sp.]